MQAAETALASASSAPSVKVESLSQASSRYSRDLSALLHTLRANLKSRVRLEVREFSHHTFPVEGQKRWWVDVLVRITEKESRSAVVLFHFFAVVAAAFPDSAAVTISSLLIIPSFYYNHFFKKYMPLKYCCLSCCCSCWCWCCWWCLLLRTSVPSSFILSFSSAWSSSEHKADQVCLTRGFPATDYEQGAVKSPHYLSIWDCASNDLYQVGKQ